MRISAPRLQTVAKTLPTSPEKESEPNPQTDTVSLSMSEVPEDFKALKDQINLYRQPRAERVRTLVDAALAQTIEKEQAWREIGEVNYVLRPLAQKILGKDRVDEFLTGSLIAVREVAQYPESTLVGLAKASKAVLHQKPEGSGKDYWTGGFEVIKHLGLRRANLAEKGALPLLTEPKVLVKVAALETLSPDDTRGVDDPLVPGAISFEASWPELQEEIDTESLPARERLLKRLDKAIEHGGAHDLVESLLAVGFDNTLKLSKRQMLHKVVRKLRESKGSSTEAGLKVLRHFWDRELTNTAVAEYSAETWQKLEALGWGEREAFAKGTLTAIYALGEYNPKLHLPERRGSLTLLTLAAPES